MICGYRHNMSELFNIQMKNNYSLKFFFFVIKKQFNLKEEILFIIR